MAKRKHRVMTVNLNKWQLDLLKTKKENISGLVRYLLDEYLKSRYGPETVEEFKKRQKENE